MTMMTSGYRAAHGLPTANHDPMPWVRADFTRAADLDDALVGLGKPPIMAPLNRPRDRFDVPDNPILAEFRGDMEGVIDTGPSVQSPAQARWWLHLMDDEPGMVSSSKWGNLAGVPDAAQIAQARRVLERLAALGAGND